MPMMSSCVVIFVFTIMDLIVKSQMSSNSKSHSLFQNKEDVRYFIENIPVAVPKDFSSSKSIRVQNDQLYSHKANLKFFPPVLDFKERYLGIPHHEKVTIINTSCNKTVHMSSISGNTVHFHSSFFQDKVIPPLGNTSFNVVFLGRGEGDIESNLFIHTSEGSFKYQVKAESVVSPYRLRPLSGVRLPLNASYSPLIFMHNPHASPLQLVEVYSSGGDFHLELPSGELEGPKHLWQIPAFLTKPIIRVRFHATIQKNHTAYIRLKVDRNEEVLVVPVEVEVGPVCGLYSADDLIDFGVGGSEDVPKQIKLYLQNSWKKPIRVQSVISMPVSKALKIDYQQVKVPPDDTKPTLVAVLTFDWKAAFESGQSSGRVIVKSSQVTQKLTLGYTATVLAGGLFYNNSQCIFQSDQAEIPPRSITLTNNYRIPIAITNAILAPDAAVYFEIINFSPAIIMPGISESLLVLKAKGVSLPKDLKLESTLHIHNNVSTLKMPLLCFNGRLIRVIPSDTNDTEINLGTVGSGSMNLVFFALVNENPIEIELSNWGTNVTGATVDVVVIERGNVSDATVAATLMEYSNVTIKNVKLAPGHYCIFQVSVSTGFDLGYFHGNIWVNSEFESVVTPLHMRVEHGSLRVITNPVVFQNCFPSAVCSAEVRVESRFTVGMAVTGLSSIPYQTRLGFVPVSPPLIPPGGNILLGHITWDMSGLEAYFSANSNASGGLRWLDTLELPAHIRELDLSLLTTRYERYLNISAELIELSLRLDTTEVRNLVFQARIQPAWPSIAQVPSRLIKFPLTQVGNLTHRNLTIFNPASRYPIIVQLVLDPTYPLPSGLVHHLPISLRPISCNMCCEFTGTNLEDVFLVSVEGAVSFQSGGEHHKKSITLSLAPMSSISVQLTFKPVNSEFSSSILLIRNNLTILETVQLTGTGAYTQFKFGNRKPGSTNPLLFELNEKHLKDCEREKARKRLIPNLTLKRSFNVRNTGPLPLTVIGFSINGQPCQGFGFKVINCYSFQLAANSTKKVDIAFTPDFTLTRVTRILSIITSDSSANYTLLATLPPYLLISCSAILGRPAWEPLLYYSAVSFMLFLLICVLAAAFFESNRILRNAIIAMSRDSVQQVLDLRLVGAEASTNYSSHNSVSLKSDSQYKSIWNINTQSDHEVSKERTKLSEDSATAVFGVIAGNNKTQVVSSVPNTKKRIERITCKRIGDAENIQEKGSWDCLHNRTNAGQLPKPAKTSSMCITTEPYTPLANIKSRELISVSKNDQIKIKSDPIRIQDTQIKKNKKRHNFLNSSPAGDDTRKKSVQTEFIQRSLEEVETSSTSTDSSNDDGEREVESMFFHSVRHHLQCKTGRNTKIKETEISHSNITTKKSLLEKGSSSSVDNEWEIDDDNLFEQGTIVKNTRRPIASVRSKKPNSGCRMRTEQPLQRPKQGTGERNAKPISRRDKPLVVKKRNEKMDKLALQTKGSVTSSNSDSILPLPPPVPVWTASFSDVVARSDSTYSSVVALKSHQQPTQQALKTENAPSLEPIGAKRPLNVWSNWSSYSEPVQPTQSTTNSLFTNSPSTLQTYESVWSEPNAMKSFQDHHRVESPQYESLPSYEGNWPVVTNLWEPLYTPSVENPPPVWGSEVWAPPTPRSLTPPEVQRNMDYDPFRSLSNIWAPPNIWKPPTSD